jgi:hypothetical protein
MLGHSVWWYDDNTLLFWLQGEDLWSIDLDTGETARESELQARYPGADVLTKDSGFEQVPTIPGYGTFDVEVLIGRDRGQGYDPNRRGIARVVDAAGQRLLEFELDPDWPEEWQFSGGWGAWAGENEVVLPLPAADPGLVNLFVIDLHDREAEFIATAATGFTTGPNFYPAGSLPIAANERFVVWQDLLCGDPSGELTVTPSVKAFDRETGSLWDLGRPGIPSMFTSDGLLALSTGFGPSVLLDLESRRYVTSALPGMYNRWSKQGRHAVGGGYAGGHGGYCS